MKILIQLTKDNINLAKLECVNLLALKNIDLSNNILIGETSYKLYELKELGKRLAYARKIFSTYKTSKKENLNTFKYINLNGLLDTFFIKEMIAKGYKVDLTTPNIILTTAFNVIWKQVLEIDRKQFEKRRNHFLPFSQPTSMHPRIARAMVNLAHSREIYDPFAGSGGILIEAGLMNVNFKGAEIDKSIYEGLKKNLMHFNLFNSSNVINADGFKAFVNQSIVTDIPYGRSSKVTTNNYVNSILTKLNPSIAILCTPSANINIISNNYIISGKASIYIHKSLTRHIYIFERQSLDI